ncbi:MAG TPA: glycosyltransferase family 2 protein [Mariprofundaceae bacterium]|nr:glycosyltransferase family 2 protein [Mariprofundaceae bacterium]
MISPDRDKSVTRPCVSIITVCFNAEEFLEETIRSVAAQDYEGIEFIIVDGVSTDATLDIIRRNEAAIARWISEPDEGIADAFNKGFALSTGDYIMCLNADDRLHGPEAIRELVGYAVANGLPEAVYGDCHVLDRDSGAFRYLASIDYEPAAFLKGRIIPHPSLLLHRSYFETYGTFDTSYRIAMDYELFLRGMLQVRVYHATCLVTDVRDGGVSTKHRALTVDEIIRALVKNGHVRPGFGEKRLRLMYAVRGLVRRVLDALHGR